MNEHELKIKSFSDYWRAGGGEKGNAQKFWLALLRDVFGIDEPEKLIDFEKKVKIEDKTKWIDGYIACTKILIEHKKFGEDLNKSAFDQAKRYADNLPYSERPRWLVTCNFAEFNVYDLVEMNSIEYILGIKTYTPLHFKLTELRYFYPRLKFFVDPNVTDVKPEIKISLDAAKIVDSIYIAFEKNYKRARIDDYKNSLDRLCTRLVFCFYASYAQILDHSRFFDCLRKCKTAQQRLDALQKIFQVLNTPDEERVNLSDDFKAFPYVNGGLFDDKIFLPAASRFEGDPMEKIFAANNPDILNWRRISPPIFGAMFESILNDETRRTGGMYYTSVENIHKVIDPLFMDDLHAEFLAAKNKHLKNRPQALLDLQDKIASLTFLDPACGSGNFLTETYLSLRRLENEILDELRALKVALPAEPVKVSINQFYGIELNSFAVAVAQTALWIAENQMLQETEGVLGKNLQAFPLKNYATVICANALRVDWAEVVKSANINYIIGNPPFVGARLKSSDQAADIKRTFDGWKNLGNLDYVTCWYKRAADFMTGTNVRAAFVSTNSVCQGDSVGTLWKRLFADGIHIDFAHRTFRWQSDSENMAHVHCVVVGFSSAPNAKPKLLFDGEKVSTASNINAYLTDGDNIFVESRTSPLQSDVPEMRFGSMPNDGGNLIIEADKLDNFLKLEPDAKDYIRLYLGAKEFINGKRRYCLWLEDVPLETIESMPHVAERVEGCRQHRLNSKSPQTRLQAATPHLFYQNAQPTTDYLLVPRVSSERRDYVPIGYLPSNVIANDSALTIPSAQIYHFGVLTSSIHMAWLRTVGGRLKSDYRYSASVVYNNFPWCVVDERRRRMIEETAQKILDVRARFSDWTLARLYDPQTMPDELRVAHKANDYAGALAYGFESFIEDEARVVAELMRLYERLTRR